MSIELPPLPRAAHVKVHTDSDGFEYWKEPHYTADQMRAYATAAVLAERERCAKLCEAEAAFAGINGKKDASALNCADAIRGTKGTP